MSCEACGDEHPKGLTVCAELLTDRGYAPGGLGLACSRPLTPQEEEQAALRAHYRAAEERARILRFPPDRPLGRLFREGASEDLYDEWLNPDAYEEDGDGWQDLDPWEDCGPAQGEIELPPRGALRLLINQEGADLSWLAALRPDDLQILDIRVPVSEADVEYLVHLAHLQELALLSSGVAQDIVERLEVALPDCEIVT
jgi:hypothetical protein